MAGDKTVESSGWPARPGVRRRSPGVVGVSPKSADLKRPSKLAAATAAAAVGVSSLAVRGGYETAIDVKHQVEDLARKVERVFDRSDDELAGYKKPALVDSRVKAVGIVNAELSPKEAEAMTQKILEAEATMANNINIDVIKRTREYEHIIDEASGKTGVPKNLLIGLVISESLGDKYAISSAGATGLTQITEGMAKELGIKTSVDTYQRDENYDPQSDEIDERYNPQIVLLRTAEKLDEYYDWRFGDWEISGWAWHAGLGNVYNAIQTYIADTYSEQLPSVDPEDPNAAETVVLYKAKIVQYQISLHRLFQNERVKDMFSEEGWDKTDEYVYRIIAAAMIYENYSGILRYEKKAAS